MYTYIDQPLFVGLISRVLEDLGVLDVQPASRGSQAESPIGATAECEVGAGVNA